MCHQRNLCWGHTALSTKCKLIKYVFVVFFPRFYLYVSLCNFVFFRCFIYMILLPSGVINDDDGDYYCYYYY